MSLNGRLKITFCLLLLSAVTVKAQNLSFARNVIDSLCAPGMAGRGYVKNGSATAALFIESQFKQLGVNALKGGYHQHFTLPVNSFPGKMKLVADGNVLIPGKDYLIRATSPTVNGRYKIVSPRAVSNEKRFVRYIKRKTNGKFLMLDEKILKIHKNIADSLLQTNFVRAAGYIVLRDKPLVWSIFSGAAPQDFPVIDISHQARKRGFKKLEINVQSEFLPAYPVSNVIGYLPGTRFPDSIVVIGAHYDHLGMMGSETFFPGADDYASRVTMMLTLAKHFVTSPPEYTLVFMAFAGEEMGLKGSSWFTSHPLFPLKQIKLMINLDMVGTGSEGITVVNSNHYPGVYNRLVRINADNEYILKVAPRGESCNSDHCPFFMAGIPAVFIYALGKEYTEYHNINDIAAKLPLSEFEDITRLLIDFLNAY